MSGYELFKLGLRMMDIFDLYYEVHNQYINRKASLRDIIPIPFLFKKIDFTEGEKRLNYILFEQEEIIDEIESYVVAHNFLNHEFYLEAVKYNESLSECILQLKDILHKLGEKSKGERYNWEEYSKELNYYEQKCIAYNQESNVFRQIHTQLLCHD